MLDNDRRASHRIRDAVVGDTVTLRRVYLDARRREFTWIAPERLRLEDFDEATRGEPILVAEVDRLPLGFASWWPPESFVHNLFVHPGHVGRGIGSALLAACLERIGRRRRAVKVRKIASIRG